MTLAADLGAAAAIICRARCLEQNQKIPAPIDRQSAHEPIGRSNGGVECSASLKNAFNALLYTDF